MASPKKRTRRRRRPKNEFRVFVLYRGHSFEFERRIRSLARVLRGEDIGSGTHLPSGLRDVEFAFATKAIRREFINAVKHLPCRDCLGVQFKTLNGWDTPKNEKKWRGHAAG